MIETTATLTTKGQVTIPKKIRDTLKLKTGDTLKFITNSKGEITITKSNSGEKRKTVLNLLSELQKINDVFIITGSSAYSQITLIEDAANSDENYYTHLINDIRESLIESNHKLLISLERLTVQEKLELGTHYEIQVDDIFESGISRIDLITVDQEEIERKPIYVEWSLSHETSYYWLVGK